MERTGDIEEGSTQRLVLWAVVCRSDVERLSEKLEPCGSHQVLAVVL